MEDFLNEQSLDGWKLITASEASDGPYLIMMKMVDIEVKPDRAAEILKHVQKDS